MKKLISTALLTLIMGQVNAAEHTVKLVTSGTDGTTMVMQPGYLKINKGDVVKAKILEMDPERVRIVYESCGCSRGSFWFSVACIRVESVYWVVQYTGVCVQRAYVILYI